MYTNELRQSSDKRIYDHCLIVICFLLLGASLFGQNGEYPYYIGTPESEIIANLPADKFQTRYSDSGIKYYIIDGISRGQSVSQSLYIDGSDKTVFAFVQDFSADDFGQLAFNVYLEGVVENSIEISKTEWRLYRNGKIVNIKLLNNNGKSWTLVYLRDNSVSPISIHQPIQPSQEKNQIGIFTIAFGDEYCGKISIPSNWKVYDEQWNDAITRNAGFASSEKVTILRASDYGNSTFYLKLSAKKLVSNELAANRGANLLNTLNSDLEDIKAYSTNKGNTILEYSKATPTTIDAAAGAYYKFADKRLAINESRMSVFYTLVKGMTYYNLTVSWDYQSAKEPEQMLTRILEDLRLCDWSSPRKN